MARRTRPASPEAAAAGHTAEVLARCAELAGRLAAPGGSDAAQLAADVAEASAIVAVAEGVAAVRLAGPVAADLAELAGLRDREAAALAAGRPAPSDAGLAAERAFELARRQEADAWRARALAGADDRAEADRAVAEARRRTEAAAEALADAEWRVRPALALASALSWRGFPLFVVGDSHGGLGVGLPPEPPTDAAKAPRLAAALEAIRRTAAVPSRDGTGWLADVLVADVLLEPDRAPRTAPNATGRPIAPMLPPPAPASVSVAPIAERAGGLLELPPPAQSMLPIFAPEPVAAPLAALDAIAGQARGAAAGRGAPLELRLFLELIFFSREEGRRDRAGAYYVLDRDRLFASLWPGGWRAAYADRLRAAIAAVDRFWLPLADPPPAWRRLGMAGPGWWRVVSIEGVAGGRLGVRVLLPEEALVGPQVDRAALREAGADSAPAHRALIALAYDWFPTAVRGWPIPEWRGVLDDPALRGDAAREARRQAAAAGRRERNPAAARLPVYSGAARVRLAFPDTGPRSPREVRRDRERADAAIRRLAKEGFVTIATHDAEGQPLRDAENARGWRLARGPLWLRDR